MYGLGKVSYTYDKGLWLIGDNIEGNNEDIGYEKECGFTFDEEIEDNTYIDRDM